MSIFAQIALREEARIARQRRARTALALATIAAAISILPPERPIVAAMGFNLFAEPDANCLLNFRYV